MSVQGQIPEYLWQYYLKNTPVGTHKAIVEEIKTFYAADGAAPYICVKWYIPALRQSFMYCFKKSKSFLSKHAEFFKMITHALGHPLSDWNLLVGMEFDITIALIPHRDEGEIEAVKITNINNNKGD